MSHIPTNFKYEIPKLYEQQDSDEMIAIAIYYVPYSDWKWYILEYSQLQNLFYCYVEPENEYRYCSVDELLQTAYDYGVDIELDVEFEPLLLKDVIGGSVKGSDEFPFNN